MAINFPGSNQYATLTSASPHNFGTGSFSYAFWLYSTAGTTQDMLKKQTGTLTSTVAGWQCGISSAAGTGFSCCIADGTTNARLDSGTHSARSGSVWAHMCVTVNRSGNVMKMFIDGTQVGGDKSISGVTGSVSNSVALTFAASAVPDRYFAGILSDIALWSAVLSATDIAILSKSRVKGIQRQIVPSSLVSYWPLDQFSDGATATGASTLLDTSANLLHSTPTNSPTGKAESALSGL